MVGERTPDTLEKAEGNQASNQSVIASQHGSSQEQTQEEPNA